MAIDDLFQAGTDKVLDDRVTRPLAEPIGRRSFGANLWGTATAAPKAVGAGANEMAAAGADILGVYGKMDYMLPEDPAMLVGSDAREKWIMSESSRSPDTFNSEIGTQFRATARSFAPDPETAGTAEQLLFGLTRFVTKAVGYTISGGPVMGAIMTGADEGMTEAERLKVQGVDLETRTKVGAAAGVVAGVSIALPIAGQTLGRTAGYVVVGGPGGFIAQQAASKAILENAGYDKLADQYDPFDPVGLAVSTLVPAGFGAYGMRGARLRAQPSVDPAARPLDQMAGNELVALKYDDARLDAYAVTAAQREGIPPEALLAIKNVGERSGSTAVSPKGAKGVMQFMDDTWSAYGKGDPRDPTASIDAGARFMKDLIKQYDGDVRAAIAHYNGGGKAGKAVAEGGAAPAKETRAYLERTDAFMAERSGTEAGRAAANDPEIVAAARVQLVRDTVESWNLRDPADTAGAQEHVNAVLRASDQIAAGTRVDIGEAMVLDSIAQARLLDNFAARLEQQRADAPAANEAFDPDVVAPLRAEIETLGQLREAMDDGAAREAAPAPDTHTAMRFNNAAEAEGYLRDQGIGASHRVKNTTRGEYDIVPKARSKSDWRAGVEAREAKLAEQLRVANENIAARAAAKTPDPAPIPGKTETLGAIPASKAPETASEPAPGAPTDKPGANPLAASLEAQSAEIARLSPDLMVQLEGMAAPMRLADALVAVKAEAAREIQDAPLLQVAAECFLRSA